MMIISEDKLVTLADGELTGSERSAVEGAVAADPVLSAKLETHQKLRRTLVNYYDPVLDEEVPAGLSSLIPAQPNNVVDLANVRARRVRPAWQNFGTIAATLVGGILIGQLLPPEEGGSPTFEQADLRVAQGPLAQALETQLASIQSRSDPVQVGVTFVGPGNQVCRTFEAFRTSGLSCRANTGWELVLLAPASGGGASEYRQAESGHALLMSKAQDLMVGEPFDSEAERQARDAGWKLSRDDKGL